MCGEFNYARQFSNQQLVLKRTEVEMKHTRSDEDSGPAAKRFVSHATFLKWQGEMNKEFQMVSWLDCEVKNERVKKLVTKLKCKVCVKFQLKIVGRCNYNNKWIVEGKSVKMEKECTSVRSCAGMSRCRLILLLTTRTVAHQSPVA